MTNAELIANIKAKIERRKKSLRAGICNEEVFTRKQRKEMLVASEELGRFKRFLSTLESEKPMNQEGLEEEIKRYGEKNMFNIPAFQQVARHFAKWGAEHSGSSEISNDLEEAAEKYAMRDKWMYEHLGDVVMKAVFFGSKWQEKKDQETIKLAEDHAFLAGADWQKEQMMKEAVEGTIICYNDDTYAVESCCFDNKEHHHHSGDKVRVIFIKEN